MSDQLVSIMNCFELSARVFQAGPLCRSGAYDEGDGLAYIHVMRRGRLRVEAPSHAALVVDEPSLLLYMNPASHTLLPLDSRTEMICGSFDFGAGMCNPIARALPEVVTMRLADAPTLDTALTLLFAEAADDKSGRQAVLDRLIEVVIVQVLRDLIDNKRVTSGLLAGLADPRLGKALHAMHSDPRRSWNLVQLAYTAGMSRARFAARFREVVGTTPAAYLTEWRLGLAQSLLRRGKSVDLVADKVGYGTASAFSRAFRARLGQTPSAWARAAML